MSRLHRKRGKMACLIAPALLAALAACNDGSTANGPEAVTEGEAAALADAEEMLGERPAGDMAEETPAAKGGND